MIETYPIPQLSKDETQPRFQNPADMCAHTYEIRRMECAGGSVQFRRQCNRCGKGLSAIPKGHLSKWERGQVPPYDRELQENVRHAAWEEWRASAERDRQGQWFDWYNGYLDSPVWHRRRAAVLKRSRGVCASCGNNHATRVHHLTYEHVGAEPLFELVAVCSPCHDQIHQEEL